MRTDSEQVHRRSMEVARAISRLSVSLVDAPFEQQERELLALQRKLLVKVEPTWERLEIRRRIAEEILVSALGAGAPWEAFGRALRRIQRLGYTDVERRVHVAILFARWAQSHPTHLPAARRLLDLAERHFRSVPSDDSHYGDMENSLGLIRREREFSADGGTSYRAG